jgi:hypothetical protein
VQHEYSPAPQRPEHRPPFLEHQHRDSS